MNSIVFFRRQPRIPYLSPSSRRFPSLVYFLESCPPFCEYVRFQRLKGFTHRLVLINAWNNLVYVFYGFQYLFPLIKRHKAESLLPYQELIRIQYHDQLSPKSLGLLKKPYMTNMNGVKPP